MMEEEADEFDLDHECAKGLNALIKTFGFSASVEVCNPAKHTYPGFVLDTYYPDFVLDTYYPDPRVPIIPSGETFYETREQVTAAVNTYITRRQENR